MFLVGFELILYDGKIEKYWSRKQYSDAALKTIIFLQRTPSPSCFRDQCFSFLHRKKKKKKKKKKKLKGNQKHHKT